MVSISDLKKVKQNPILACRWVNQQVQSIGFDQLRDSTNIFDEDWDNIIILDACRSDLLMEYSDNLPDNDFATVWSGGSSSKEFLQYNIGDRSLDDVVYVTANPFVLEFDDNIYETYHAWDTHWSDEQKTVLPGDLQEVALEAAAEFPDKRIVIHFMQPHYPFIGDFGRSSIPHHRSFTGNGIRTESDEPDIWDLLKTNQVDESSVWKAYSENLELTLPFCEELVDRLEGKTVLTADHGNAFGERSYPIPIKVYGHPYGLRLQSLIEVPWVEFPFTTRRHTKSSQITENRTNLDVPTSQLQDLGYM
jgi:hypothetical protein